MKKLLETCALLMFLSLFWIPLAAQPLALHPANPHYFLFRGQPTILITSAEHYGAVLNQDFDYVKYLDTLARAGLNHTRLFTGAAYVEPQGAFNIERNTLAPAARRYLAPWARSAQPGYANGGNKFDLSQWDESYWRRLKDFLTQAAKRGIVVEVNLFCAQYSDRQWGLSPFNAQNNINGLGKLNWRDLYTLDKHAELLPVMERFTRRCVAELQAFDNIYYEVMNEPYATEVPLAWQHHIADVIVEAEKSFPSKHLIALNVSNGSQKVEQPHPAISIFNFHYATPPETVALNYDLNKVIGDNETGFRGTRDEPYRMEGWDFILAGGGLFNHLDYSFAVGHEDGTFKYPDTQPGGGNASFRQSLWALRDFIYSFDFVRMKPDSATIKGGVPGGYTARALSEAGRAYAIYLRPLSYTQFSARWTGFIEPKFSEEYTFYTRSNDGVRLWVDDKLVIDNWTDHGEVEDSGKLSLVAGKQHKLKLEYFYAGGWGVTRLAWASASQPKQNVPAQQFTLPANLPGGSARGLLAEYFPNIKLENRLLTRRDADVNFTWGNGLSPFALEKTSATALLLELPAGSYRAEWVETQRGAVVKREMFKTAGGVRKLNAPKYQDDIALRIIAAGVK